jgi:predicted branched-subunit amino acid permease
MKYFKEGVKSGIPVAATFVSSFVAVGVFLRQAGFNVGQTTAMTAAVFAGPAQYSIAQAVDSSQELLPLLCLVLVINARIFVMATALVESFRIFSWSRSCSSDARGALFKREHVCRHAIFGRRN